MLTAIDRFDRYWLPQARCAERSWRRGDVRPTSMKRKSVGSTRTSDFCLYCGNDFDRADRPRQYIGKFGLCTVCYQDGGWRLRRAGKCVQLVNVHLGRREFYDAQKRFVEQMQDRLVESMRGSDDDGEPTG